jgi:hypothetical protein
VLTGEALAERKHQRAESVINRLSGFMDAEALRAVADGVSTSTRCLTPRPLLHCVPNCAN